MKFLIDSSVWVDYFRSGKKSKELDVLIEENLIVINDLILAELVPPLLVRNFKKVAKLLYSIEKLHLDLNWLEIIAIQTDCISKGYNGIGVPDIIIAQNSIQNKSPVFSLDNHFDYISEVTSLELM